MTENSVIISIGFGILIIYLAFDMVGNMKAKARLQAMKQLMDTVIRSTSGRYERQGEELDPAVAKAVDELHDRVQAQKNYKRKAEVYRVYAGSLANAMADACVARGFQSGQDWTEPREGKIRVDLTLQALLDLKWTAHVGFERLVKHDGLYQPEFETQEEAQRAAAAIEELERRTPKERRHPEPHAMSFNRRTMIWDRWPSEKQA